MRRTVPFKLVLLFSLLFASAAHAQTLRVLVHDSFSLPTALIEEFTAETGIEVEFLSGGDAGQLINRAILTKARPIADLLFGVDDNLLERAREEGIFEPYLSPEMSGVPRELWLDPDGLVTPVDVGYVVPNLDLGWFAAAGLEHPGSLAALSEERYSGTLVALNPTSSSPGLAFLLATIVCFGDPTAGIAADEECRANGADFADWLAFWAALRDNELSVTDGWTDAYYTAFSRYGGDRPIVVSYATSPAAEVIFAEPATAAEEPAASGSAADDAGSSGTPQAPTANLQCPGCAYRQVEGIGILAGTDEPEAAREFVDFMLSRQVQEAVPLEMFVAPVVDDAAQPEEFELYASLEPLVVAEPLPAATVRANQQRWLAQWTAVVMQGRDPASVR